MVPEVPILTKLSLVNEFNAEPVFKSTLNKASSSFRTISILSVPIPVDITVSLV